MADNKLRQGALIHHDILEQTKKMTDEKFGKLMRAVLLYSRDGIIADFDDDALDFSFSFLKTNIDNCKSGYEKRCETNRQIALGRWQKEKDTNAYERIRTHANATNNNNNILSSFNISSFNKPSSSNISSFNSSFNNSSSMSVKNEKKSKTTKNKAASTSDADTPEFDKISYLIKLFERLWLNYPHKVGKEQAKTTWSKKFKSLKTKIDIDSKATLINALLTNHLNSWKTEVQKNGQTGRPKQYIPHFSTWLNDNIPNEEK